MRRTSIAIAWLVACTPPVHEKKPPAEKPLATLSLKDGRTAIVSAIDEAATASPEALRHYLKVTGDITSRQAISDGFVATIDTETYVIRELHHAWIRCHATTPDAATRDEVIALCRSFKP
jgi:hypothetical protein